MASELTPAAADSDFAGADFAGADFVGADFAPADAGSAASCVAIGVGGDLSAGCKVVESNREGSVEVSFWLIARWIRERALTGKDFVHPLHQLLGLQLFQHLGEALRLASGLFDQAILEARLGARL